jgi:hypothetical protein
METLQRCLLTLEPLLSIKSKEDGKMIDEKLLMEIKENLFSIQNQLRDEQERNNEKYEDQEIAKVIAQRKKAGI